MAKAKSAIKIIDAMVGDDRSLRAMIADETLLATVARMVYDARTKARLTHKGLADLVGTKSSVIARLEDADYRGDSLSMLNRIARALNRRLTLRMTPPARGRRGA